MVGGLVGRPAGSQQRPRAAPTGKHSNAQSLHRFCIVPVAIAAGVAATFGSTVGGSFPQPAEA
jgi:hypothetical protein